MIRTNRLMGDRHSTTTIPLGESCKQECTGYENLHFEENGMYETDIYQKKKNLMVQVIPQQTRMIQEGATGERPECLVWSGMRMLVGRLAAPQDTGEHPKDTLANTEDILALGCKKEIFN